ncbi:MULTISPECIES: Coenzyme F420 hydrogenase/dehydrogenase, beta subunit C-terminal domain [Providencia]|uniref:Coenzyme F420 hydrogenase/dehydrogenase, beta subunit C-terminal domain n=1 Tax=Providencia TaxID=586 RepID=UPI00141A148B|nr:MULTISPECIES: Coenzyme F420 hydrogenase/dehydrogenase, beta subunit C-terminal domain [Providencia]ELR5146635.1 Coenzyme F420 hydrogenase/dehydrogenase, beta subunit C-terminal domain [Providencia rettgeri]NIA44658.1 4Fe-4S ferredoxin [Providencia rettgeri]NIA96914.1 4Fe-4S ferredoxin [Providencia rettgeri]NIB14738.1 4Fe-4S ferredoxin [Providencia rettgeri]NIB34950.1 4Fe-4S ferredoxin [Providencia rettgeri]
MSCSKNLITSVVETGLCIGCGACTFQCKNKSLEMHWNEYGFLQPRKVKPCNEHCDCIKVCPFNPNPDITVKTENELATIFITDSTNHHIKIGKYTSTYAGYSNQYRMSSSSGGIATYIFSKLLEKNIVDKILIVRAGESKENFYEYSVITSADDLLVSSKTRYYPVTLSTALNKLDELDGNIAVVGVGCFLKSIRLLQQYNPDLKERIKFLVGIICGGIKSKFFTEYLATKTKTPLIELNSPEFRIKDPNGTANNYSFGCKNDKNELHSIKMRTLGDMWGTGLFKAKACDFCDDVTTELADISLGDAWLNPYQQDGRGTNVVVTRSALSEQLIQDGVQSSELTIEPLSLEKFLQSQSGSYNHRHDALAFRLQRAQKEKVKIPPKRFANVKISLLMKLIHHNRMKLREKSLVIWKSNNDAEIFDNKIKYNRLILKVLSKINRVLIKITKR